LAANTRQLYIHASSGTAVHIPTCSAAALLCLVSSHEAPWLLHLFAFIRCSSQHKTSHSTCVAKPTASLPLSACHVLPHLMLQRR
jgi:hypothetical protein